jgi:hypothetical protein
MMSKPVRVITDSVNTASTTKNIRNAGGEITVLGNAGPDAIALR